MSSKKADTALFAALVLGCVLSVVASLASFFWMLWLANPPHHAPVNHRAVAILIPIFIITGILGYALGWNAWDKA
jgi:drug/metabolite transporter (DMT)-like permease